MDIVSIGRNITIGIENRRAKGIEAKELAPQVLVAETGAVAFVEIARHTQLDDCRRSNIYIHIHAVVPALVIGISVVFFT